ncbi:ccr4 associated factor [Coemansia sp. Benny D115]|nr:ccr4 associated factor [Coemansia sp. Benny D115]
MNVLRHISVTAARARLCRRMYTQQRGSALETALDGASQYARLEGRAVLEVSGPDASEFLQGMQCNDMGRMAGPGTGMLTAFLHPQGRILADALVYGVADGFLVEVDASASARVLRMLQFYRLRARVKLRDCSAELGVWSAWGPDSQGLGAGAGARAWMCDARAPNMGQRVVVARDTELQAPAGFEQRPAAEYALRRMLKGVAEGAVDMTPDQALPLESNLDFMGGVHFSKGCYVGQELTIRTHHRGTVRKRLLPVVYSLDPTAPEAVDRSFSPAALPAPQTDITRVPQDATSAGLAEPPRARRAAVPGRTASAVCNVGLALVRLEHVTGAAHTQAQLETVGADGTRVFVHPYVPAWWPAQAQEQTQAQN